MSGNSPVIYNSCDLRNRGNPMFSVGGGCACLIQAAGMSPDQTLPIEVWVGDDKRSQGLWAPARDIYCGLYVVSDTCSTVVVDVPGCYRINTSSIPYDGEVPCEPVILTKRSVSPREYELMKDILPEADKAACAPDTYTALPGYVEADTGQCLPVFYLAKCTDQGLQENVYYLDPTTKVMTMAVNIQPPGSDPEVCETVDTLPFRIDGPDGPSTYAEILTAALAASPTDFNFNGTAVAAADTDKVIAIDISRLEGNSFLLNGEAVGGVSDPDGVNMANTVEVPDGCAVQVVFCLRKCLSKAELAAL